MLETAFADKPRDMDAARVLLARRQAKRRAHRTC
jgi:hypothetical protein